MSRPDHPPSALDEADLLDISAQHAHAVAVALPSTSRFMLRDRVTPVQRAFLHHFGFLLFDRVLQALEVERFLAEIDRIQAHLLQTQQKWIFGVPIWFGQDPDGQPYVQRLAFANVFSADIEALIQDDRFEPVRQLIGADARIGYREKDGVVVNRYLNHPGSLRGGAAWHTDGLRDLFYNARMPDPQLNVGLHLSRIRPSTDGGLRILPGTHQQGVRNMLFGKATWLDNRPDAREVAIETWPGDLTVHDGRAWHRVQPSSRQGWESQRVSVYVPYLTDEYQPKGPSTRPMMYMRLFHAVMQAKRLLNQLRA
ncbi:MAG: phytanoyl-CoA dioxygenase family protein [Myxococcota bacterium]